MMIKYLILILIATSSRTQTLDEEDTYEKDVWRVVKVGGPSPLKELTFGTDAIPQEGWYIKVKKGRGVPLEAHLNKKLKERYYLVRHNEVMAYEVR